MGRLVCALAKEARNPNERAARHHANAPHVLATSGRPLSRAPSHAPALQRVPGTREKKDEREGRKEEETPLSCRVVMNAFDLADPSEEPGFPELSTTPRSIRNMENIIAEIHANTPPDSPLPSPKSPVKAKSMSGRDVWHLGKGTSGPGSKTFKEVKRDKWDTHSPGGSTVWDQIIRSEKAKETRNA